MTRSIQARLLDHIATELLGGDGADLDAQTPLLEWGVIDSMSMIALLGFIETEFGVAVPDEQVRPEHFQSVERLAALIASLGDESEQVA